jgi:hypothetical protein
MHGKPKVLLATTCRWFSAARLGISFAQTGCVVEAVRPPGHPIALTRAAQKHYSYDAFSPAASLRTAIEKSKPDLVIPCDDLAAIHLRRIYGSAAGYEAPISGEVVDLLTRSMGDPSSYPIVASRGKFLALAREQGIRTPATEDVGSPEEVRAWCEQSGFPAVLKADGTSGGQGVKTVHTMEQALAAFRHLHAPVPATVVLKRASIDRDLNLIVPWMKRKRHRFQHRRRLLEGRSDRVGRRRGPADLASARPRIGDSPCPRRRNAAHHQNPRAPPVTLRIMRPGFSGRSENR